MDVLIVEVDGQRYGILVAEVLEILPIFTVATLPGAPAVVAGVVNLRGEVVPVVDVRRRVGAPDSPVVPSDRLVVVHPGRTLALRVDAAREVTHVAAAELRPVGHLGARHVAGVATTDDGLLVVYDLPGFLTDDESALLDVALATPPAATR